MGAQYRPFLIKNGGTVKDVDLKGRRVTGYFASFGTLDSDGDVFKQGAFAKSLIENKDRIMHLLQHCTQLPLARPDVLREDNFGLYFESPFPITQLNDETLALYDAKVYNEHSVGFETLRSVPDQTGEYETFAPPWDPENERAANIIVEAKLWEGSTVTWGANPNTPFLGSKSASVELMIKHIAARKEYALKALKVNGLTDTTYERLENELKALSLITSPAPPSSTQADVSMVKMLEQLNNLKTNF